MHWKGGSILAYRVLKSNPKNRMIPDEMKEKYLGTSYDFDESHHEVMGMRDRT